MWLRNWDNIQVIKMTGAVETTYTSEFGDNSLALKNCQGKVFCGYVPMFCGSSIPGTWFEETNLHSKQYNISYSTNHNSSFITNLNLSGVWNEATTYEDFSTKFIRFDIKSDANSENFRQYNASTTGIVMLVGSGKTAESYDDYCLESEITDLSHVSYAVTDMKKDINEKKWIAYITRTFRNDTSKEIQVSEVAIYIMLQSANSESYKHQEPICVYRKVIDPVIIAPLDIRTFSIKIELPANG